MNKTHITLAFVFIMIFTYAQESPPSPGSDSNKNWVSSINYNILGNTIGKNINYFNEGGKPIENQTWDIATEKVWAKKIFYDQYNRVALTTLSAPQNGFGINSTFIRDNNGGFFNNIDYDLPSTIDEPSPVSDNSILGSYYSNNNIQNPFQDVTSYPYTKYIYSKINPSKTLRAVGNNKIDNEWKSVYSFTMPVSQELSQQRAFNDLDYDNIKALKTVTRDLHDVETITFTDLDGKILATARSGNEENPTLESRTMTIKMKEQNFIDIHIPVGITGFSISNPTPYQIRVYDLISEELVTQSTSTLPNGFYRVSALGINGEEYVYDTDSPIQITYKENYYDFTLKYYNKAKQVVLSKQALNHLEGNFDYNSKGELISASKIDQGLKEFKYTKDGHIRFSQNSKQESNNEFSYTNYDLQSRPIESGVLLSSEFQSANPDSNIPAGVRKEQKFIEYDFININEIQTLNPPVEYTNPQFLPGNISKTSNNENTSFYSYDIYGRVDWILQNINGLGVKTIDYEYDSIKGVVSRVIYQKHSSQELFIHKYTYSEDNLLIKVETSTDDINYTIHAEYEYNDNKTLKRFELAEGIQGIDYVYNINGQLKAINHPELNATMDPGGDSNDLFGMTLDYYNSDYQRNDNFNIPQTGTDQYNGNIKANTWNTNSGSISSPVQYRYDYNKNNWLTDATFFSDDTIASITSDIILDEITLNNQTVQASESITFLPGFIVTASSNSIFIAEITNTTQEPPSDDDYKVFGITYDANGNIQRLNRNKNTEDGSNVMDALRYSYDTQKPNQLKRVEDAITQETNANDIKTQSSPDNYQYNSIGELINNLEEGLSYSYNASGLVIEIKKDGNTLVKFFYDERGHRIKKETHLNSGIQETFYVRDMKGTPLAIYNQSNIKNPIYGSKRIGVYDKNALTSTYEITDHIGNVRALIIKSDTNTASLIGKTDYYPFGESMPNRNIVSDYRYAFQGQEKDEETDMEAFKLRLWDGRIGRWLTTDPAAQFSSPYLGLGNNPINGTDPDGAFWEELGNYLDGKGWNSNAALKFQAEGGVLGEWVGNKFTGYRTGTFDTGEENGVGIAVFLAKDDFKKGLISGLDTFGLNGRVAVGKAGKISADIESSWAKFGGGGSIGISSMMFIGGDYGFYWYDYGSAEIGPNGGVSVAAGLANLSITGEGEVIIAVYVGEDSPHPSQLEGMSGSLDFNIKANAILGADLGAGVTYGGGWLAFNVTLGVGLNSTPEASTAVSGRVIGSQLLNPVVIPTVDRTWTDILSNHLIHALGGVGSFD